MGQFANDNCAISETASIKASVTLDSYKISTVAGGTSFSSLSNASKEVICRGIAFLATLCCSSPNLSSASAARAFASAWAESPAIRALLPKSNSNATPPPISTSAMAWGISSESGLPAAISVPSSTANPNTIAQPASSARSVYRSYTTAGGWGFLGVPFATYIRPRFKPSRALITVALIVFAAYVAVFLWLVFKALVWGGAP